MNLESSIKTVPLPHPPYNMWTSWFVMRRRWRDATIIRLLYTTAASYRWWLDDCQRSTPSEARGRVIQEGALMSVPMLHHPQMLWHWKLPSRQQVTMVFGRNTLEALLWLSKWSKWQTRTAPEGKTGQMSTPFYPNLSFCWNGPIPSHMCLLGWVPCKWPEAAMGLVQRGHLARLSVCLVVLLSFCLFL